jgi:hypothetical protein
MTRTGQFFISLLETDSPPRLNQRRPAEVATAVEHQIRGSTETFMGSGDVEIFFFKVILFARNIKSLLPLLLNIVFSCDNGCCGSLDARRCGKMASKAGTHA